MTRDSFAISNKLLLDQMARTGAFAHLIRRKAALSDTGLTHSHMTKFWTEPD